MTRSWRSRVFDIKKGGAEAQVGELQPLLNHTTDLIPRHYHTQDHHLHKQPLKLEPVQPINHRTHLILHLIERLHPDFRVCALQLVGKIRSEEAIGEGFSVV